MWCRHLFPMESKWMSSHEALLAQITLWSNCNGLFSIALSLWARLSLYQITEHIYQVPIYRHSYVHQVRAYITRLLQVQYAYLTYTALAAWLVGIAFPFYGTLNSVIGAFSGPVVAFAMPCLAFNLVYRWATNCKGVHFNSFLGFLWLTSKGTAFAVVLLLLSDWSLLCLALVCKLTDLLQQDSLNVIPAFASNRVVLASNYFHPEALLPPKSNSDPHCLIPTFKWNCV